MRTLAIAFVVLTACGGGSSSAPKESTPEERSAPEEASAPEQPPPEDEPPREAPEYTFASTGNAICDELIAKTMCTYEKTPDVPSETLDEYRDMIQAYTDALRNEATREAAIDACEMSLAGGEAGFKEMGCW